MVISAPTYSYSSVAQVVVHQVHQVDVSVVSQVEYPWTSPVFDTVCPIAFVRASRSPSVNVLLNAANFSVSERASDSET